MMFKMNLTFTDSPVTSKYQELCNKLNNHEKINALLISTDKVSRQTIQQHEEEIKTLKAALQAKEGTIKELNDRIETMEALNQYLSTNGAEKSSKEQQSNNKYNNYGFKKQLCTETNEAGGNYFYAKKVESSTSKLRNQNQNDYQQEVVSNARNGHNATASHEPDSLDEMRRNMVVIRNFKSSDLSQDNALANVIGLAERMGLTLTPDHIKHIRVIPEDKHFLSYFVYFVTKHMKEQFLKNIYMLQKLSETKFLTIF